MLLHELATMGQSCLTHACKKRPRTVNKQHLSLSITVGTNYLSTNTDASGSIRSFVIEIVKYSRPFHGYIDFSSPSCFLAVVSWLSCQIQP